ncbi:MAG: hypothetical protein GY937_00990 [bacterium]|nr:hypothetical protein [bacterium]
MSRGAGVVVLAVFFGVIGANGLVFGDPSWAKVGLGFLAGVVFAVTFACFYYLTPKAATSSPTVAMTLIGALSGFLTALAWWWVQNDSPELAVICAVGVVLGGIVGCCLARADVTAPGSS